MRITEIKAVPISFRVPEGKNVRLGIGRAVKRDAVLVKVLTDEGIVGWGETAVLYTLLGVEDGFEQNLKTTCHQ